MIWLWCGLAAAQTLPAVKAETLSGRVVDLPGAPPAARTALVLAFKRSQQDDLDLWRPELARLTAGDARDWLELPFVDVPGILRGLIGGAMNRSIEDPVTREHYAPVWASPEDVKQAVGIVSDDAIVLVVVDAQGAVLFRHDGAPTPQGVAGLEAALRD